MKKIEYVALKYYNSCVSEECLYVGMLFNNLTDNERTFVSIKNFKRLAVFDDDVNIEFFKDYLKSIKDEVEMNVFNYDKEFVLKDYIRPFTNELKFSKITTVETDEPDFVMDKFVIKVFDFDNKDLTKIISTAKSWAYNAREMKEEKKTIFLYDSDVLGSEEFKIIKSILSEDAYKVLPVDRGIEYLTT